MKTTPPSGDSPGRVPPGAALNQLIAIIDDMKKFAQTQIRADPLAGFPPAYLLDYADALRAALDAPQPAPGAALDLESLLAEIALVLRQVELTAHRADALPPADYAQKPTVAEWRERVTWLVFTLNRTREFLCIATARCATDSGQSGASESNPSRSTPAPNAGISTASPTTCASTDHGNVGAALDAQPPQAPQKEQ